ncbi:MAG: family NAD(P)-dependent oxidoreductase [Rhizobacter sp.]|nr:family NAD(P)-dependent oxidoreductase [Rhizobacter sp.]
MSEQRIALVTGAASGIGLAIATRFARADLRVLMVDRNPEIEAIAARLDPANALGFVADLADTEQVLGVVEHLKAKLGHCDVLVNNAGIHPKVNGRIVPLEETELEAWELVFRINLTAPFLLCKHLMPAMRERQWGRVVNISSRTARTYSDRAGTHYTASKAGLIGMTRKMAGDYAPFHITANCVAPGQIETPLARTSTPEVLALAAKSTPAGRLGTADEVASAVAYLASDDAAFITGAVIDVNGGGFIG